MILTALVLLAWVLVTAATVGWYARAFDAADEQATPPRLLDQDRSAHC
ncbi:hypothetical protein [Geodermatophilus sp. CPCC 206100]